MIHARIVAPADTSRQALELLKRNRSVCNVVFLEGAAHSPEGDVILADLAREDASVVLSDLRELDIHRTGSISLDDIDAQLSSFAAEAERRAPGAPGDAVVWEEVQARTSELTELTWGFVVFMILAALIAAVGIYLDSAILIVGAMVVGPEFGPIAGFCVAAVQKRRDVALRSAAALALGFPAAITVVYLATLIFRGLGLTEEVLASDPGSIANLIAHPDFFAFFVAACAGAAGMLSLSTAKSGALIGVLISVTTIPAAANIGIAAAYRDWNSWQGSMLQLAVNMSAILLAGTATLFLQRMLYVRRRRRHLDDPSRAAGGLPIGRRARFSPSRETTTRPPSS